MKASKTIYNGMHAECASVEDVNRYKALIAQMLYDMAEVCDENGIDYILAYGTLLGAVRHSGYIPWDDDIDIHMLYDDIPRFKKFFLEKYGDKYGFIEVPRKPIYFDMVEVKGTRVYELEADHERLAKGAKIDIFPLEYVSSSSKGEWLREKMKVLICRIDSLRKNFLYPSHSLQHSNDLKIKAYFLLRRFVGFFCCVFPVKFLDGFYRRFCINHKEQDMVTTDLSSKKFPLSLIHDRVLLPFEGHEVYGPRDFDGYLKTMYGDDYMDIPSEDKREIHSLLKIDLGEWK